jgi:hypothetical protein
MRTYPTSNACNQTAFIVNDIDEAVEKRVKQFGIGPFFYNHFDEEYTKMLYRGQPSKLEVKLALTYVNGVQFELIQPMSKEPNCYRDMFSEGKEGFHHFCCWSHDLDGDIDYYAKIGYKTLNLGEVNGEVNFAYVDTRPLLGCMMELLEYSPETAAYFEAMHEEVKNWDGKTDPVRPFPEMASASTA